MKERFDVLDIVPKNIFSFFVGKLTRIKRPKFFVNFIKQKFVSMYSINLSEASKSLKQYKSLEDLFTRSLKPGSRPIEEGMIVSPCDGCISQMGKIENEKLLQVKGIEYKLRKLLRVPSIISLPEEELLKLDSFFTVYLSPRNYHRVHSPVDGKVKAIYVIKGNLWPVNDRYVGKIPSLFVENERMIFEIEVEPQEGIFYRVFVVMVGALNVGRIRESVTGRRIYTNDIFSKKNGRILLNNPIPVKKGEELGVFMLGSTVVTVFEKAMLESCGQELLSLEKASIKMGKNISDKKA